MTIFFDWQKVCRKCKYDSYAVLKTVTQFAKSGVPAQLAGNSFILNIHDLAASKYYDAEKFDYVLLAAIRNYFDYAYQGNSGLWLPMIHTVDKVKIQKNRLLQITDNYIHFKYEDTQSWP